MKSGKSVVKQVHKATSTSALRQSKSKTKGSSTAVKAPVKTKANLKGLQKRKVLQKKIKNWQQRISKWQKLVRVTDKNR